MEKNPAEFLIPEAAVNRFVHRIPAVLALVPALAALTDRA